ncbi:hypothetical protein [Acinetobacter haemolyticus]|uniref:hypothetical protein n=1 Tax=Acinetobacter haemolyticus TaxID=29430 RepID=UPI000F736902|nr:hypothetical protein [Acinetobacter haemolyticus]RSN77923.1 hypothetical protein EA769_03635 [Acinetobacter haemolyticus]
MNNQVNAANFTAEAPKDHQQRNRALLVAQLAKQKLLTQQAKDDLVYSKRFYRAFVGILIALIVVMYGGLWYAKTVLSAACY